MESVWIFPGKPVLLTDSARPFVLALAEWKGQNDGTGMGWHFQHARSPQIPWLIIIFAIKFAILDYPPGLGKPIYHCCRCLHHSKPALPICNVNGQTAAHIWATILKASRIPSCKQTNRHFWFIYLPSAFWRFVWIAHPLPGMALCNSVLDVGYEP